jgi:hypothetical protein
MFLIRVWLGCDHVLISLWSDGDQSVIRMWSDIVMRDCDQRLWSGYDLIVIRHCLRSCDLVVVWGFYLAVIRLWSGYDQGLLSGHDQRLWSFYGQAVIRVWSDFDRAVISMRPCSYGLPSGEKLYCLCLFTTNQTNDPFGLYSTHGRIKMTTSLCLFLQHTPRCRHHFILISSSVLYNYLVVHKKIIRFHPDVLLFQLLCCQLARWSDTWIPITDSPKNKHYVTKIKESCWKMGACRDSFLWLNA